MNKELPRFIVRYIAIVVSITAIVTGISAIKTSNDLKTSLIEACQTTRTPIQQYFVDQLNQQKATGIQVIKELFPNTPIESLKPLIQQQLRSLEKVVTVYDPAQCDDIYN